MSPITQKELMKTTEKKVLSTALNVYALGTAHFTQDKN